MRGPQRITSPTAAPPIDYQMSEVQNHVWFLLFGCLVYHSPVDYFHWNCRLGNVCVAYHAKCIKCIITLSNDPVKRYQKLVKKRKWRQAERDLEQLREFNYVKVVYILYIIL